MMSSYEQKPSQPSAEFLATIHPGDLKDLDKKAQAAVTDHRSLNTCVHWLLFYADLHCTEPKERLAYETQVATSARKLDSNPIETEKIIQRYEERIAQEHFYGET